ncbi:MAG: hypothetical protein U9R47_05760, partial [Actinomycetota bacterium]|nr:hypothetical protein [Actinomycetota bacterium]
MSSLRERNALYARLEEVLGPDHAVTLMDHIPAEVDLATKADITTLGDRLNALGYRLDARIDGIDGRLEHVESRLDRLETHMVRFEDKLDGFHQALRDQTRTYMLTMTGVMASFAAVVVA